jgi:NIMA (never in mitosis gene a)-related kinase
MRKYEEVRVLGEGSFGRAILSRRKSDGQPVVIKEIRIASMAPNQRADAQREASILSSLDHSFIIKYYESFQERDLFCIAMEYADGGDLSVLIENRASGPPLNESEVIKIFVQICLAIKHIHDKRILHRDLKCKNIFLMKDGTAKLGDFGISRVLESTFQLCNTQIGTPFYISPEICRGKPYNSKTDIWSLGCILYELCTLRRAFTAFNMNALFANIIKGKYDPIPRSFSNDLQQLISRMLTCDPKSRPSINAVLATPFIRAHLDQCIPAAIVTPPRGIRPAASCISAVNLNLNLEALRSEEEGRRRQLDDIAQRREEAEKQRKLAAEFRRRSDDIERRLHKVESPRPRRQRLLGPGNRRTARNSNARPSPVVEDTFQQQPGAAPAWARPEPQVRVVLADEETLKLVKNIPQAIPVVTPRIPPLRSFIGSVGSSSGRRESDNSMEDRRRQLEKQRAELDANKKAFEEFGMRSLKDIAELSPIEVQPKVSRAISSPDITPAPFDNHSVELAKSRVSRIHDLVHSVKYGLDTENDLDDEFEAPNTKPVFVINNAEVSFPVVCDSDSITYRAEAIRAYLEKELGLEKLLDLRDEVDDQHHGRSARAELSKTVPSGYVVLMWHLVTLDEMITGI